MSSNPPDPVDQANQQAAATPSPENPFSPAPSTSPVAVASPAAPTSPTTTISTAPPADFVSFAGAILAGRIGAYRYPLLAAADKNALIEKMWIDSSIQGDYSIYKSNPAALGALTTQIETVLMGQGDDPTVVNDYVALKQQVGEGLTVQEQAALAGATQATNAPVPRPFGSNTVSGYDFGAPMPAGGWSSKAPGQSFGWSTHNGVDYGTQAGSRIVSPFAGVATVETGVAGYGNYVTVTLDNGWKMGFGHVASGQVANGARVNPGDLIAIAGANVGSAQGSVTIVTWQNPQGQYINPHDVLDPIFSGTTFAGIGASAAAGTGQPTVNKVLDTEYPTIKSDWQTYFGSPPSPEDVYNVIQHGTSPAQWTDYIRSLPGHIDGMTTGQAYDVRQNADAVSTKVLGHPSTDGIVQELFQQQLTTPQAITNWYNEHGNTGIDPPTYNAIYTATQPAMTNIFNDTGADPRVIKSIHDGAPGHPGPQAQ